MSIKLTEAMIQQRIDARSFQRGKEYFSNGNVLEVAQRGSLLFGQVRGSEYDPYDVKVMLEEGMIKSTKCSCPVGDNCKHVAALLLSYVHHHEEVIQRPTWEKISADLSAEEMRTILSQLAQKHPQFIDWFEEEENHFRLLQSKTNSPSKVKPTLPPVDPVAIAKKVKNKMRQYHFNEYGGSNDYTDLIEIADSANDYLAQDDVENAWIILSEIADQTIPDAIEMDHYGDGAGELVDVLAELFTELSLRATAVPYKQKKVWVSKLNEWQKIIDNYLDTVGISTAAYALKVGWRAPILQQVFGSEHPLLSADSDDKYDDKYKENYHQPLLNRIYLQLLNSRGEIELYQQLAKAVDYVAYLESLLQGGELQKAVEESEQLQVPADLLIFAQTLSNHLPDSALAVAKRGLEIEPLYLPLGNWVYEKALKRGDSALVLRVASMLFYRTWNVSDYQKVKNCFSAEEWVQAREPILQRLRTDCNSSTNQVQIFLHENFVVDAIASYKATSYFYNSTLLHTLLSKAIPVEPTWVIAKGKSLAEEIMNNKRSKEYSNAVEWLKIVRDAYKNMGEIGTWATYKAELIALHNRKSSLKPLLMGL